MFGRKKAPKSTAPKSTSKEAKTLIRQEALSIFSKDFGYSDYRTRLERMKLQADAAYSGYNRQNASNYNKARSLVNEGFYRVYYDDQAEFLSEIYGEETVKGWSSDKIQNTYAHLIAREYEAMLREDAKKPSKFAKKVTKSKPKTTAMIVLTKPTATKKLTPAKVSKKVPAKTKTRKKQSTIQSNLPVKKSKVAKRTPAKKAAKKK